MRVSRKRARRIADLLRFATYAVVAWGFIYPRPYDVAMFALAALPLIAVVIAVIGRDAFTLEGRKDDPRPQLSLPVMIPGMVLAFRAVADQELLDWQPILWLTIGITAAWVAILYAAEPEVRPNKLSLTLMALVLAAYGYGASVLIDTQCDAHEPAVFATRVLARHEIGGRSRTFYFDVAPWGPRREHGDVTVRRALYDQTGEGGTVCVYLWPGALGARWFETENCPRG